MSVPLIQLAKGQEAKISRLTGSDDEQHNLRRMGLVEGKQVEILRDSSTCIVRCGQCRIAITRNCLEQILVDDCANCSNRDNCCERKESSLRSKLIRTYLKIKF